MQDTRSLGLVHWDDLEGWYGDLDRVYLVGTVGTVKVSPLYVVRLNDMMPVNTLV